LPDFEVFLTQPLLLAALQPGPPPASSGSVAAPGQPSAAAPAVLPPGQGVGAPANRNPNDRVPRDQQLDSIAGQIVSASSRAALEHRRSLSRPLRSRVLASANEQDEDAPHSDEELLRNIARPNGWYTRVRDSLSAIAPLFVISFIRAVYGDKLFSYNPDRRPEYGEEPIPFAAGPIDAVTAYCLASNHELLNCPMLARWYRNLHTNVRARAIDTLHDAVPEEMAIPTKPKGGAPPGQARLWRLNLAEVCGQALRASGWIIQPGTPCGPVPTPQALAAFSAHYLRHYY